MDAARKIHLTSIAVTVALAVVAAVFHSTDAAVAVLAGGVIAATNFRLFSRQLHTVFGPGGPKNNGRGSVFISAIFRYAMIGGMILLVIKSGISPVFLLVGLSAVVAAIFITFKSIKTNKEGVL